MGFLKKKAKKQQQQQAKSELQAAGTQIFSAGTKKK